MEGGRGRVRLDCFSSTRKGPNPSRSTNPSPHIAVICREGRREGGTEGRNMQSLSPHSRDLQGGKEGGRKGRTEHAIPLPT